MDKIIGLNKLVNEAKIIERNILSLSKVLQNIDKVNKIQFLENDTVIDIIDVDKNTLIPLLTVLGNIIKQKLLDIRKRKESM